MLINFILFVIYFIKCFTTLHQHIHDKHMMIIPLYILHALDKTIYSDRYFISKNNKNQLYAYYVSLECANTLVLYTKSYFFSMSRILCKSCNLMRSLGPGSRIHELRAWIDKVWHLKPLGSYLYAPNCFYMFIFLFFDSKNI